MQHGYSVSSQTLQQCIQNYQRPSSSGVPLCPLTSYFHRDRNQGYRSWRKASFLSSHMHVPLGPGSRQFTCPWSDTVFYSKKRRGNTNFLRVRTRVWRVKYHPRNNEFHHPEVGENKILKHTIFCTTFIYVFVGTFWCTYSCVDFSKYLSIFRLRSELQRNSCTSGISSSNSPADNNVVGVRSLTPPHSPKNNQIKSWEF
jgi:hypothetical protein